MPVPHGSAGSIVRSRCLVLAGAACCGSILLVSASDVDIDVLINWCIDVLTLLLILLFRTSKLI